VQSSRRQRLVGLQYRGVFGTMERGPPVLSVGGRKLTTACIARRNLDIRQRVAAGGRRVHPVCQGDMGLRDQLGLVQVSHHCVCPHASWRQALAAPVATHGRGSAQVWRPCTPAMAAGWTDHVWSVREVRWYRVPPWPQP
jgi:hypothetical protein